MSVPQFDDTADRDEAAAQRRGLDARRRLLFIFAPLLALVAAALVWFSSWTPTVIGAFGLPLFAMTAVTLLVALDCEG